jgi:hypothetical protein
MLVSRLLFGSALFVTFSLTGLASTIPGDPDIALDPGAASMPLRKGTNFAENQPTDYFNPFPEIMTALTFDLTMNTGLTCSNGTGSLDCGSAGSFHCQSGYFLTCGFTYTASNGDLLIDFSGTNPWDGDPTDSLVNKMEGIPPLLPGCLSTPDVKGCGVVGHFDIGLSGWSQAESPRLFSGTPTFTVADVGLAPEPGTEVLIGSVLLIGAGFAGSRRRRRSVR